MRKLVLPLAFAATAVSGLAAAQTPAAPTPSPLTGNITLASEYRFRGIDQTNGKPALQGGFDYSHASGVYLGNWNSNVSQGAGFPGASLEMDFYGGYKKAFGDFGLDVGAIYYYYPGSNAGTGILFSPVNNRTGQVHSGAVNNKEVYIGGSWKWLSAKWFYSIDDYFSAPGTEGTHYLDLAATYDLGNGLNLVGHYGRLSFKEMDNANYSDWKLGVTKDLSGWVLGAAYIGTNAKGSCSNAEFYCFGNPNGQYGRDAGRSTVVLSVSRTF
ncbi:MAG TPA: TorF family putative porin [Burkholderiales bacterium]|nr:TorF family putative porin [Burkholderiales bacterium]